MEYENNDINIFGTFRTLTPAQIKCNAIYAAGWVVAFSIVVAGVAIAVLTGIVWIGPVIGIVGLSSLYFVSRMRYMRYTPRFGKKYNIMRWVICGCLIYGGVAWRGLLGFYNYLCWKQGYNISIIPYGWTILSISLTIALVSKLCLYRITDVHIADLVGIIETTALATFIGSIMFLLLYT